ncbi:MAG: hypothetical protein R2879_20500 [Saprospiraceae bacterium]
MIQDSQMVKKTIPKSRTLKINGLDFHYVDDTKYQCTLDAECKRIEAFVSNLILFYYKEHCEGVPVEEIETGLFKVEFYDTAFVNKHKSIIIDDISPYTSDQLKKPFFANNAPNFEHLQYADSFSKNHQIEAHYFQSYATAHCRKNGNTEILFHLVSINQIGEITGWETTILFYDSNGNKIDNWTSKGEVRDTWISKEGNLAIVIKDFSGWYGFTYPDSATVFQIINLNKSEVILEEYSKKDKPFSFINEIEEDLLHVAIFTKEKKERSKTYREIILIDVKNRIKYDSKIQIDSMVDLRNKVDDFYHYLIERKLALETRF